MGNRPVLSQTKAASLLGLSERTLERFRMEGRGPRFLKLGKRVFYDEMDIQEWKTSRRRSSTREEPDRQR